VTLAATGHAALDGVFGFGSRGPQRECTLSARRDKGKLSVAFDMDSPITEEPSRFDFPIHCEPSIRLRGLTPVGRVRTPPSFLPLIPHRHVVFGHRESTIHGGPHDDNF
jgi:hypothetical protein